MPTPTKAAPRSARTKTTAARPQRPKLLAGENPQIEKGDGAAPVRAYLAAIPGWKRGAAKKLDALLTAAAPGVRKAVKWSSPFYGAPGKDDWFLSFHMTKGYVKLAFFQGRALRPMPAEPSTQAEVRYHHVHEGEPLDEAQLMAWFRAAAALPGWNPRTR